MQIVLITGSGRKGGLGYETAKQLGEKGYHVILSARKTEAELAALAEELTQKGISTSYVPMVSAKSVIWAAILPDDGPTGGFFRDGKELPW